MKIEHWLICVGIIIITVLCFIPNDYMKSNRTKCTILDKMIVPGRYSHIYLILKDDNNRIFDLDVSPSTYSQHKIGDTIVFNLREFDIKQNPKDNIIYFFGHAILAIISITIIVVSLISLLYDLLYD